MSERTEFPAGRGFWKTTLVVVLVALVAIGAGTGTGTVAAQQAVTGCQTIDTPGDYVLQNDVSGNTGGLSGTCIEINSGRVTFDGQGNTVTGSDDSDSTGIEVSGDFATTMNDVTVKDVDVRGFGTGISLSFVNESEITGVDVRGANGTGINIGESSKNLITNNDIRGNEQGMSIASLFLAAEENTVRNNDIDNNNGTGVVFFLGATNSTVEDNRIRNNRDLGVASLLSFGNKVTDNSVSGSFVGVTTLLSADNEISNNDITNNGAGVANLVSFNETLRNNRINDNREAGVFLLSAFGTNVVESEVKNNTRDFVNLFTPTAEQVAENELDFSQGQMGDIIDENVDNVVERTEFGSSGAETVLSFESNNATVSGVEPSVVPSPPSGADDLSLYFNATDGVDTEGLEESLDDVDEAEDVDENLTEDDLRSIEQPENPFVDVGVHFDDSAVPDADESNLSVWRYDEETDTWEELSSSTVDTQNDVVSANITTFSTFGVFGAGGGSGDGDEDGDRGGSGGSLSPNNPFADSAGNPVSRQTAISRVVQWNMNGEINGASFTRQEIINSVVQWNLERSR